MGSFLLPWSVGALGALARDCHRRTFQTECVVVVVVVVVGGGGGGGGEFQCFV